MASVDEFRDDVREFIAAHLPAELARCALMLEDGGIFQAGIPSEGGCLWGLAWRLSTGFSYRLRTGLDYGALMRHEHVNRADEIIAMLRHFFGVVQVWRFPLNFHHLSFYAYIDARNPNVPACEAYLTAIGD